MHKLWSMKSVDVNCIDVGAEHWGQCQEWVLTEACTPWNCSHTPKDENVPTQFFLVLSQANFAFCGSNNINNNKERKKEIIVIGIALPNREECRLLKNLHQLFFFDSDFQHVSASSCYIQILLSTKQCPE